MKLKQAFILAGVFLLNSCIVKSLNPFYTEDKVVYDNRLEGLWKSKKATWKIQPFIKLWEEQEQKNELYTETAEDKKIKEQYKDSYVLEYKTDARTKNFANLAFSYFVLTAFKVDEHTFVNFLPLEYDTEGLNNLVAQHILNANSVCKVDFLEDNSIQLKWLDEDVINRLIDSHNLKIKHERIGLEEDLVLTANSRELYSFLEKFMKSDIENKWEKDQIYKLTQVNE